LLIYSFIYREDGEDDDVLSCVIGESEGDCVIVTFTLIPNKL